MTMQWYPKIDKSVCTECMACLEYCEREVYAERNGKVHVSNKENCLDGCKDCKKYCMLKCVYFPDDLAKMKEEGKNVCNCGEHMLSGE